jgi:hypothetical protein
MDHIGSRYGLAVDVKTPKEMREEPTYQGLEVDRCQVAVTTNPGQRNLPTQKIKLEVANVPAHTRELSTLDRNYSFLPPSYQDLLLPVESLDEILADKIVSLSSCQSYIRHRDIWDILWLTHEGAEINESLVAAKVEDYQSRNFEEALANMSRNVKSITKSQAFEKEMSRFIDARVRSKTIDRPGYMESIGSRVSRTLSRTHRKLYGQDMDMEPEGFMI